MRARWLLLGLLAACGRVGFSSSPDAAAPTVTSRDGGPPIDAPDAAPSDPSLVAHYTMDGLTSEEVLLDVSGYGNRGSCAVARCPGTAAGQVDSALTFDGVQQEISVPVAPSLSFTGALTVSAWFKSPPIGDSNTHCFISRPVGTGIDDSWQLCVDAQSQLYGEIDTGGAIGGSLTSTPTFTANAWQHAALTCDGMTMVLYLNGASVGSTPCTRLIYDDDPMLIGADSDNGMFHAGFAGAVDEVRIYNRALVADEITMLASQ